MVKETFNRQISIIKRRIPTPIKHRIKVALVPCYRLLRGWILGATLRDATALLAASDFRAALHKVESVLTRHPRHSGALNLKSRILIAQARTLLREAQFDQALTCINEVLRIKPGHPKTLVLKSNCLYAEARALQRDWQLDKALSKVDEALALQPLLTNALHLRAAILMHLGRGKEAALCCHNTLRENPLDLRAIGLLRSMGEPVPICRDRVLQFIAAHKKPETYLVAARYLNEAGFFDDVVDLTNSIGAADPITTAKLLMERARAHEHLGNHQDAATVYRQVDQSLSDKLAHDAKCGLARCELETGNPKAALAALDGMPVGKHHLPILYALGDLRTAHLSYRTRVNSHAIAQCFALPPPEEINIKSGRYSAIDALLFAEAGPGDEIRFAAIYEELADWFKGLTITCDPRLHSLMARSFPNIEFLPVPRYRPELMPAKKLADRAGIPAMKFAPFMNDEALARAKSCGFVCSMLDTLGEFRAERDDFQRSPSRLIPDPTLVQLYAGQGNKMRIGIAWRSILLSTARSLHYLQVEDLEPLAKIRNAEFWVLQACASESELQTLRSILPNVKIPDVDLLDDFEGQAALMSTMDCVISPLTTTAELAGMVGARTYILSTTHTTTWRRNSDGSDVWYENGRLVCGSPVHDRRSLMENVVDQIMDTQTGQQERLFFQSRMAHTPRKEASKQWNKTTATT